MSENLHAKHRERMRKRFASTDSDGFSDHELMEMLLYYTIPRKNTNDIAHRLLNRFGSFEGVFSASIDDLMQVEDIGLASAIYLKIIFAIHKRMLVENMPEIYKTYDDIGELFLRKFKHIKTETMIFLLFDKRGRICREVHLVSDSTDKVAVDLKNVVAAAACKEARYAAVAHNHPSGLLKFSFDDKYLTVTLKETLSVLGIDLVDHFLVADGEYIGLSKDNYTDKDM